MTGTLDGSVHALGVPGTLNASANTESVASSYESPDLGWQAVGLATGDLDSDLPGGDPQHEIVAGVLVDTGSFEDWVNGDLSRNRGHLYVLDPDATTGTLDVVVDLTDQDALGRAVGAGVFGVKADVCVGTARVGAQAGVPAATWARRHRYRPDRAGVAVHPGGRRRQTLKPASGGWTSIQAAPWRAK